MRIPLLVQWSCSLLVTLFLTACGTTGSSSGGRGGVGEIHLFGVPVTLSAPGGNTPAGIGVRVYASAVGGSRGLPITQGVLEVQMFDGVVREAALRSTMPSKSWAFDRVQLRQFADTSFLGDGYQLALNWGQDVPKSKVLTVVARHRVGSGPWIYSTPSTITVAGK